MNYTSLFSFFYLQGPHCARSEWELPAGQGRRLQGRLPHDAGSAQRRFREGRRTVHREWIVVQRKRFSVLLKTAVPVLAPLREKKYPCYFDWVKSLLLNSGTAVLSSARFRSSTYDYRFFGAWWALIPFAKLSYSNRYIRFFMSARLRLKNHESETESRHD